MKVLNISDALWEYASNHANAYVFFTNQHFINKGDLDASTAYFARKYEEDKSSLKGRAAASQLDALKSQLETKGYDAAQVLDIAGGLANGKLLDQAIVQLGDTLDTIVQDFYNNSPDGQDLQSYLNAISTQKSSCASLLENGPTSSAKLKQFFNFILQGLNLMGQIDPDILNGFTQLGKKLSIDGEAFTFRGSNNLTNRVKTATEADKERARQIIDYLSKAANILKTQGSVSRQSFMGTLNNIFSTVIGESIAKTILEKSLEQADEVVINQLLSVPGMQLTGDTSFKQTGNLSTDLGGAKTDLLNTSAFSMRVTGGSGNVYTIELMSNFSVKTYSAQNTNIKIVDRTPLGDSLAKMDNEGRYYAYNIFAHRKSGGGWTTAYQELRSSLAATYLDQWMTGSGTKIAGTSGIDKVQYLMINGKIYSIPEVISRIVDKGMMQDRTLSMSISGRDSSINKWQSGKDSNLELAKKRSELTREAINNLVITMHFNSNILK